ncbi:MAG: molybdenum cofactor biosynthesis protein MoaE [Pseudomonadales bacterium]
MADFSVAGEYSAALERLRAEDPGATGAIAAFVGLVRDVAPEGSGTLTLEHYPGMTERSIERIVEQAQARWPLQDVVVIHRVGALAPQSQIVLVLTASAHRSAAFAACEFIMDYLKTDAVFWKREGGAAGSRWIESNADDRERVAAWQAASRAGEDESA